MNRNMPAVEGGGGVLILRVTLLSLVDTEKVFKLSYCFKEVNMLHARDVAHTFWPSVIQRRRLHFQSQTRSWPVRPRLSSGADEPLFF